MYTLPKLSYAYDALSRSISADIMRLHHEKHHQSYVDKLNAALDEHPELKDVPLEALLSSKETPRAIINHGGGHYNHSLFWRWMDPNGGGEPEGELGRRIIEKYGSFQAFVDIFSKEAAGLFGSGWVWLQPNLEVITTRNQDTPMLSVGAEPILGLDVWEHAYYLDYKNVRADYVKAWWDVVDWDLVGERLRAA